MKPDALLPFAIAAIMGFLALGLRGGQKDVDFSKIRGRVQFVESFADYKVKAVEDSPDLRVQIVKNFPDAPGKWQVVSSFPDYKIQLVDTLPDFTGLRPSPTYSRLLGVTVPCRSEHAHLADEGSTMILKTCASTCCLCRVGCMARRHALRR